MVRMWVTKKNGIMFEQLQALNFMSSISKLVKVIFIVVFSLEEEVWACYKCGLFLWKKLIVLVFKLGVAWNIRLYTG
jgi:hypothetical protein